MVDTVGSGSVDSFAFERVRIRTGVRIAATQTRTTKVTIAASMIFSRPVRGRLHAHSRWKKLFELVLADDVSISIVRFCLSEYTTTRSGITFIAAHARYLFFSDGEKVNIR